MGDVSSTIHWCFGVVAVAVAVVIVQVFLRHALVVPREMPSGFDMNVCERWQTGVKGGRSRGGYEGQRCTTPAARSLVSFARPFFCATPVCALM